MRDSEPFFNSFLGRLVIVWMSFNFLILLMKLNGLDHEGNIAWRVFLSPLWSFDLFLLYSICAGIVGLITYFGLSFAFENLPSTKRKIILEKENQEQFRKMIVLLDFYRFWLNVKLSVGYTELTKSELTETYIDEANACLVKCGYEELFAANPYDWLFLCAAYSEKPIEYFRACMSPDMWTDDEDFQGNAD